jgi:hypothetical protein
MKTKSKLKTILEFGGVHGVIGKAFDESNLLEFISQFLELSCERVFGEFCC